MSLEAVKEARRQIDEAQSTLSSTARETIQTELQSLLTSNPDIKSISWAQKASEYNDEGMYPGVFGPVVNAFATEDEMYDNRYDQDWLYSYGSKTATDPRLKNLEAILEAVGEDILSDLFGDENVTTVFRTDRGANIVSEYAGC